MNISNNIASIKVQETLMNVSANNIANVSTDRFIPVDAKMINNRDSVVATTQKADDSGVLKSQTDLTKEILDQIITQNSTTVNATVIKTQNEMFSSLLDIKA